MSTDPGSLVLDPFGGSGTTYVAAELSGRRWVGSELECSSIIERFDALESDREHIEEIWSQKNRLFTDTDLKRRAKSGKPLSQNYRIEDRSEIEKDACGCAPFVQEQSVADLT